MVSRRSFLGFAAAVPLAAQRPARTPRRHSPRARCPCAAPARSKIAFKSPTPRPNGLQATPEGLWIIDQGPGSRASLVRYSDGTVIRSFDTDTVRPSGHHLRRPGACGSARPSATRTCAVDATTGAVLERRPTPGCMTYTMAGDPPARAGARWRRRLPHRRHGRPARTAPCRHHRRRDSRRHRRSASRARTGRNGAMDKLWTTATCARSIYEIDPATWTVLRVLQTPGPRPHGLAWEGRDRCGTATATSTRSSDTTSPPTASSSASSWPTPTRSPTA